jgi:hypothetical protein
MRLPSPVMIQVMRSTAGCNAAMVSSPSLCAFD